MSGLIPRRQATHEIADVAVALVGANLGNALTDGLGARAHGGIALRVPMLGERERATLIERVGDRGALLRVSGVRSRPIAVHSTRSGR